MLPDAASDVQERAINVVHALTDSYYSSLSGSLVLFASKSWNEGPDRYMTSNCAESQLQGKLGLLYRVQYLGHEV